MDTIALLLLGMIWLGAVIGLHRRARHHAGVTDLWRDVLAGGVLFLLLLGFFWRTLIGDVYQPADGGDLVSFLFPTYRFAAGELAQGRLPLWNPALYGGAPFVGDIQAGFLYLPNLVLFLLNPFFGYGTLQWLSVLHLFWAGLGMYVLLRTLIWETEPVSRLAAMFGATAFMFCDPLLIHIGNLNLIAVLSWLPWMLAPYARALRTNSLRWIGVAALLFAVSTYAGHAQSTAYVGIALVLYTIGQVVSAQGQGPSGTASQRPWRAALLLGAVVGLTLLLTAPILLPALEMTRFTVRSEFTYQDAIAYSLAPTQALAGLVTPSFFGRGPALHWSLWDRVELPYAGVATLMLAVAALLLASAATRRRLWTWVGIALFGLLVSLGVYGILHGWLTALVPLFDQFRAPARALILWTFGLSVLATVGVDEVMRAARATQQDSAAQARFTTILRAGAVLLALIAVPLAYFALLLTQADETTFLRASLAALALVFAAVFWVATWAILAGRRAGWYGATAGGVLLLALIFVDLSSTGSYTDISPTDPTQGFQHPAIVDFLRADPDLFRIDTRTDIDDLWQPDTAALVGLQDVNGIANPLALRSARTFWESTGGRGTRRYDLLNVKYVIVRAGDPLPEGKFERAFGPDGGLEVYRNLDFAPRAWMVAGDADLANVPAPATATGATVTYYASTGMTIEVQAPAAGYLILSEVWYPGWQATVNGIPAAVDEAGGLFRAVPVPAGASTVALRFWPAPFTWGLLAGVIGVILVLATFIWPLRTRRRPS